MTELDSPTHQISCTNICHEGTRKFYTKSYKSKVIENKLEQFII